MRKPVSEVRTSSAVANSQFHPWFPESFNAQIPHIVLCLRTAMNVCIMIWWLIHCFCNPHTEPEIMVCTWFGEFFPAVAYLLCSTCLQHSPNHVQTIISGSVELRFVQVCWKNKMISFKLYEFVNSYYVLVVLIKWQHLSDFFVSDLGRHF